MPKLTRFAFGHAQASCKGAIPAWNLPENVYIMSAFLVGVGVDHSKNLGPKWPPSVPKNETKYTQTNQIHLRPCLGVFGSIFLGLKMAHIAPNLWYGPPQHRPGRRTWYRHCLGDFRLGWPLTNKTNPNIAPTTSLPLKKTFFLKKRSKDDLVLASSHPRQVVWAHSGVVWWWSLTLRLAAHSLGCAGSYLIIKFNLL